MIRRVVIRRAGIRRVAISRVVIRRVVIKRGAPAEACVSIQTVVAMAVTDGCNNCAETSQAAMTQM